VSGALFSNRRFRSGAAYRLVEWCDLEQHEKELLSGLYDESEVYGIFRPVVSRADLTIKVAYREIALIYLHLTHPRGLPHYLFMSSQEKAVIQLVLDGVLEIESEGGFLSGAASVPALLGDTLAPISGVPNYLSRLSTRAINYGLRLRNQDPRSLANRLYTFNTVPWDARKKMAFLSEQSVREFLFSAATTSTKRLLLELWTEEPLTEQSYWISWSKKKANHEPAADKPTYKIYVSPVMRDLPVVFEQVARILSGEETISMKAGLRIEGLLRPDKMVAYFANWESLASAATRLSKALNGYSAQGVIFTAQLGESGLLSWGVDPPVTQLVNAVEAGSWRYSVADQTALAILQAQTEKVSDGEALDFIRAKLLAAGVDTETWTHSNDPATVDFKLS